MKLEDFRKVHNFDKLFTYDLAVSNALSSSLIRFHSNASIEIGTKKMPMANPLIHFTIQFISLSR